MKQSLARIAVLICALTFWIVCCSDYGHDTSSVIMISNIREDSILINGNEVRASSVKKTDLATKEIDSSEEKCFSHETEESNNERQYGSMVASLFEESCIAEICDTEEEQEESSICSGTEWVEAMEEMDIPETSETHLHSYVPVTKKISDVWDETIIVTDKAAWDETITVTDAEAWDEVVTVVDKEAWDETVTVTDYEAWDEEVLIHEAGDYIVEEEPHSFCYCGYDLDLAMKETGLDFDDVLDSHQIRSMDEVYVFLDSLDQYMEEYPGELEAKFSYDQLHELNAMALTPELRNILQATYPERGIKCLCGGWTFGGMVPTKWGHYDAEYEMVHHDAVTHTEVVHHPADTHQEIVHHEVITHTEVVHHPAETHTETVKHEAEYITYEYCEICGEIKE